MILSAVIDLRPLIDGVVFPILETVIAPVVTGAAGWAMIHLAKLAKATVTQHEILMVEGAMQRGITFALSKAHAAADSHSVVTTKEAVIAEAANYVLPKIPDYLAALGITPQGLAERIEARLPVDFKAVGPSAT